MRVPNGSQAPDDLGYSIVCCDRYGGVQIQARFDHGLTPTQEHGHKPLVVCANVFAQNHYALLQSKPSSLFHDL